MAKLRQNRGTISKCEICRNQRNGNHIQISFAKRHVRLCVSHLQLAH